MRGRHLLVVDVIGLVLAAYVALAFRFDADHALQKVPVFAPVLLVLLAVRVATNMRTGLYSRGWRFASIPELGRIVVAVLVGTVITIGVVYGADAAFGVSWTKEFPRSFWVGELLATLAVLGGVRFAIRAATEWSPGVSHAADPSLRPTLLYGAGRSGASMAMSAMRKPKAGVLPVGFLDDDPHLAGGFVGDLRIFGGLEALDRAIAATGAEALLITMPDAAGTKIREVVDAALARGLDVRTVPSIGDLLDGTLDAYRVRRVQVEDLLRRTTGTEHPAIVHEIIGDRVVLITGAGGSIGSELARQVFALGPRRLILVDRSESALYLVQRELEAKRDRDHPLAELRAHLANVASRAAMDRLVATERPDVIFHAAAYKHVPMMEEHPSDAAHVNIGGTLALLDAAVANDVERFVLVSTDKAVRPSSVMGASKRVAEMLVAEAARRTGKPYVSVRFGNVLGSNGSVVPIFQEQLEKGEPLTITHPEMSRYFMTIREAAWLILDAAALGTNGDLFVLDMGKPIRIVDLAHDLVRLAGRDPDTQPIDFVGLRPGEKLHEELFYEAEQVEPTSVAKVLRATPQVPPADVRDQVHGLLALATGGREVELRAALLEYATRSVELSPAADDEHAAASESRVLPVKSVERPEPMAVAR
ncbi:MAG: polysaccharide biosynthesis protein [Chloroflexi bacterium]|nr:polysaccharide biosynthesis protein [Chloroflexota bacterium]